MLLILIVKSDFSELIDSNSLLTSEDIKIFIENCIRQYSPTRNDSLLWVSDE